MPLAKLDMRAPKKVRYGELIDWGNWQFKKAHSPLSDYRVGVAAHIWDGRVYGGVNVEDSDISLTQHAEMITLGRMIADGVLEEAKDKGLTPFNFLKAVAVTTERGFDAWPCGHCRHYISSFGQQMDVVVQSSTGRAHWRPMFKVLPYAPDSSKLIELTRFGKLGGLVHMPQAVDQLSREQAFDLWKNMQGVIDTSKIMSFLSPSDPSPHQQLLDMAIEAGKFSASVYTKRPVGAAVWLYNGNVYRCCRIENVGYIFSSYAEIAALNMAVANGELLNAMNQGVKACDFIRAIAYAPLEQPNTWPNGSSRQCLCEFGLNTVVITADNNDQATTLTMQDLLPDAFVPDFLSYWTHPESG